MTCTDELKTILGMVNTVLNIIRWAIPIILIVLVTLDVAKIVTAGNLDDKLKKEVTGKITTRLIYAVIIFLIPTIIWLVMGLLPSSVTGYTDQGVTWKQCLDSAK